MTTLILNREDVERLEKSKKEMFIGQPYRKMYDKHLTYLCYRFGEEGKEFSNKQDAINYMNQQNKL